MDLPVTFGHSNSLIGNRQAMDPGLDAAAVLMLFLVVVLLLVFEFCKAISPFVARKLTHLSMGTLILLMMLPEPRRHSVTLQCILGFVAVSSIALAFLRPFRFGKYADKGIIIFNGLVVVWLLFGLDFGFLAPAFFADPMGAIVGTCIKSKRWYGDKTVAGTLGVFVTTIIACFRVPDMAVRIGLAAICAFLEAVGGEYDNLLMSIPIFMYYAAVSNQSALG